MISTTNSDWVHSCYCQALHSMQEILQWAKSNFAQHIASVISAVCCVQLYFLLAVDQWVLQLQHAYRDVADSVIDSERSGQGADVQAGEVSDIISKAVSV